MTVKAKHTFLALVILLNIILLCGCGSSKDKDKNVEKTYDEWLDFYKKFIKEHYEEWEGLSSDNLKYDLFYIDEDNIPEVVIGYGSQHVYGLYIFSTDGNKVYNLGCHGESGRISYLPQKNNIYISYGNQGFFRHLFLSINDNKMDINSALVSDGHTMTPHYYIIDGNKYTGHSLINKGDLDGTHIIDGDMDMADIFDSYENYEVSDQDYKERFNKASGDLVDIRYEDLKYSINTN